MAVLGSSECHSTGVQIEGPPGRDEQYGQHSASGPNAEVGTVDVRLIAEA